MCPFDSTPSLLDNACSPCPLPRLTKSTKVTDQFLPVRVPDRARISSLGGEHKQIQRFMMDGLRRQGWIILIWGLLDERRLKPDVIDLYDLAAYFGEQAWAHCPSGYLEACLYLAWISFQGGKSVVVSGIECVILVFDVDSTARVKLSGSFTF